MYLSIASASYIKVMVEEKGSKQIYLSKMIIRNVFILPIYNGYKK